MVEILACRVCLATDVKLFDMYRNELISAFETLTGTKIMSSDGLPRHMCSYCSALLIKFTAFREKCHNAKELMRYMMEREKISIEELRTYNQPPLTTTKQENVDYLNIKEEEIKEENKDNIEIDMDNFPETNDFTEVIDNDFVDIKYEDFSDEEPLSKKVKKKGFKNYELVDSDIDVVMLSKEQQIEEIQLRKDSLNYQNSSYKCHLCFKGFMTETTYNNHMIRHDPKTGNHVCEICETRWPNHRTLRAHLATSHERKYICKLCNHVSKSSYRAKEHSKWHNGYTFICKICGATFSKSTSHLTHVRLHHPSKHCCELCGESFIGKNGLNMHRKKAHHDVQEMRERADCQCSYCGVKFNNTEAVQRHMSGTENDLCDTSMMPCIQCGDSFSTDELLKEHFRSHSKEEPTKCNECDRTFASERSYSIHCQRMHLRLRQGARRPNRGSRVVCEICGKECLSRANLVYHQRTHTGEKPYACTECPKKFSVYQRLQIHIRTHTGERPFKCSHCPKAFKHKAALNRHDRVHTGAKPYTCSHCGKSFSQSNSMKLHVRTVHLKMPAPYRNARGKQGEAYTSVL